MTVDEANRIFAEVGEALTAQALNEPDRFGPNLRCASRRDIRKAIMLWLAMHKAQGRNLLQRVEISPGKFQAIQELADTIWQLSRMLGWRVDSPKEFEGAESFDEASRFYDEFIQFLHALPKEAPDYWPKIYRKLFVF